MEQPGLTWSGTYAVLSGEAAGNRTLPGDKITLPQSALEELLAASHVKAHVGSSSFYNAPSSFSSPTPNSPMFGNNVQELPTPLMFRLTNRYNDKEVYAGIREFSAPEGTLGLSLFLQEALGITSEQLAHETLSGTNGDHEGDDNNTAMSPTAAITVHARQLEKGTYARLRPLEAGYNPDDWKALLERQLRENFTTMSKDSVLSVNGPQGETFKFLADKFLPEGDGICVVDTDLEVDIEALNEEQARETMRQIMSKAQPGSASGSSRGGELDIWKSCDGQVIPGEYVDYNLPSWDRSQNLSVTLAGLDDPDSLDVFITPKSKQHRDTPRDNSHVFGNFLAAKNGSKSIIISPTNAELDDAKSLMISVHAYRPPQDAESSSRPISYTIRAAATPAKTHTGDEMETDDSTQHTSNDQQCELCRQWVPKASMLLHESFCRRHNIVCPICKSVFPKNSREGGEHWDCGLCSEGYAYGNSQFGSIKHNDVFHGERKCQFCEFTSSSLPDLARHRTTVCPGKIILCRFCHLEVPQEGDPFNPSPEAVLSGLTAHELADGARTTDCHLCSKIVRLRDMETHMKHHELDKVGRLKPTICRNVNCGRTLHGVGPRGQTGSTNPHALDPGNDIGLCSICYGPLFVSMHDPDGKALRRRIERRYLGQLMTGCKRSHCNNSWCRTGRSNMKLEPHGSTAQAALPLVKPLVEAIPNRDEHMHFCVDETNQRRRTVAEMIAAEKGWDFEWCIAAAEAEGGDPAKTREWLQAWAPRR